MWSGWLCGNEGDGVDERVLFYVVGWNLIVDGKCLGCCEEGKEVVGVALRGEWILIVQFEKRRWRVRISMSVDANTEMGRMQKQYETGCVAWTFTTNGCVCLKKQKNSFEYIGTTGWHLQLQELQEQYCEYIACACIQMISMGESPSLSWECLFMTCWFT